MKIVFLGSSDFSLPALEACSTSRHEVSLVLSTPDRPKGRGLKWSATPVKQYALDHSIPCETPEHPKKDPVIQKLRDLQPDLFVVSSYGKIIPADWLAIARKANLNVHPSLLPQYRGAAPIQWPILNGDPETGLTIMEVTEKLDQGDIYAQELYPLDSHIQADELSRILAERSKKLLLDVIDQIEKGTAKKTPQNESLASYARKLTKEDGRLHWSRSAVELHNQIRGLRPWPSAFFESQGESVQVLSSCLIDHEGSSIPVGTIVAIEKERLVLQTGLGRLALLTVKPHGKREMTASDYARGRHLSKDMNL